MIIKTLFLAGFMLASALASEVEGNEPFPAALLVQSNFDFSLTRKEFRVHYGGPRTETTPTKVSIKLYGPDKEEALSYDLKDGKERKTSQAFHFALDEVKEGKYEVEVCADGKCSARTPSLTNVDKTSGKHMFSCVKHDSTNIDIAFAEPKDEDWAKETDYTTFSEIINEARRNAGDIAGANYKTDNEKYKMDGANPYYKRAESMFHAAIMYDLTIYKDLFDTTKVNDYCGRKNMLSLHSHIVDKATKKVILRLKTVNHLSEGGKKIFISGKPGVKILLESTHKDVDIPIGDYELWVSLCVTDKDTIESTYCANPITKPFKVTE